MRHAALGFLFSMAVATAQDAATPAGPLKKGSAVPSTFRALVAADDRYAKDNPRNRVQKMHDLVTDNGLNPVLVAFVRTAPAAGSPGEKLGKEMSALFAKYKADRLGTFIVFLTLDQEYQLDTDRDAKRQAAEALFAQLKGTEANFGVPFAIAAKASPETKAWTLEDKDEVAIFYYNRMTVQNAWRFAADQLPNDDAVKAIKDAIAADLKPKK
jgi:hypothetical protein